MFYISRLLLRNIKCFPDTVKIDFHIPSADRRSWTLLFGENGTGKTTLLRCIAIGLCDKTGASGLLTELTGKLIRDGADSAEIHIDLVSHRDPSNPHTIKTTITRNYLEREEVDQQSSRQNEFSHRDIFACGYGANFGTIGSQLQERYDIIEAVYTLFNYEARLQNPENALFRIEKADEAPSAILETLLKHIDQILVLPPGSTKLDSSGLRVSGPWGVNIPANDIGDGYAATIAWICDLLGWHLLAKRFQPPEHIRGIVLLDEMERHLHPSWQRQVLCRLSEVFPQLQFIATSHAPMAPIGALDLPDSSCQLVVLKHSGNGVILRPNAYLPPHSRADQVLTSDLFDLAATTSDRIVLAIEQYARLKALGRHHTDDERLTIQSLESTIERALGTPETSLQRRVEKAVKYTLDVLSDSDDIDQKAVNYEARRQIKSIFQDNQ